MARTIAFSFCRYSITDVEGGATLSGTEQFELLQRVKGQTIAYRKRGAVPDDETTFLCTPRRSEIDGHDVLTWRVADQLAARVRTRYNKDRDETSDEMDTTDEIRAARFVAVPRFGILAIDDRASDRHLGARSAAGRFRAILQTNDVNASVEFAGTPQDIDRALQSWTLDQFNFTVRPTNPHPPKLGEKLDELIKADQVGKLRGVATPSSKEPMKISDTGLLMEAKGLSDAGYGQYGAAGITAEGLKATITSPKFDMVRENNVRRQAESRAIRIHVEQKSSLAEEDAQVVKALVEMYG